MNFELDEDQRAVLDGVEAILSRHAGAGRAMELHAAGDRHDDELAAALAGAGFDAIAAVDGMGLLEAALATEAVSYAGGVVAFGARALVVGGLAIGGDGPLDALAGSDVGGPVALADRLDAPVRFGAHARHLLLVPADSDEARWLELPPGSATAVPSTFGYPMGAVPSALADRAAPLGAGSAARARDLWRLALAVEAVGAMRACLDATVGYLKVRRQFGRAIGSFQAVQHRLADCVVLIEGSRWLAYEAAHHGAPAEAVATAASYALAAAAHVSRETHQLSGAIGFTREYELHVWSMRLHALRLELAGTRGHRRALAAARWGASS